LQALERLDRLRQRRIRVELVREVDVDVVDAETVEARLELPCDPGASEAAVLAGVHRVERLGGDLRALAPAGDPRPDRSLAAAAAVRVGSVERRQAELPGGVHDQKRFLLALALAEELRRGADAAEVATAEDEARDLHAAPPELAAFHAPILAQAGWPRC
jgi:hypothetical protein